MAHQNTTFVFIDEDQQNKYSKQTLSAINAQVAKYSRKQRLTLPKSHSAPASPPQVGSSKGKADTSQDERVKFRDRRRSDSTNNTTKRKTLDLKLLPVRRTDKQNREKHVSKQIAGKAVSSSANVTNNSHVDYSAPENLTSLLENLCRITKLPSYQAFPFFLNLEERRLAHYWFTEVLREDFGVSRLQLEGSFQGSLTKYPLAFQVPLRWIIAHSAQRLYNKTGSQSLTVVYRSQQQALNKLQDILTNPETPTDEAISSIQYSIVHNPESRKIHLRGMDAMIEARGGMDKVLQECKVAQADHLFLQYTFAEFEITEREELETLKSQFFEAILAIQQASIRYFQVKSQMEKWASSVDLADCHDYGRINMQMWSYTEQRSRVFGPKTAMGQLIRQNFDRNANSMSKSRLFGALFQLATILLEYDTIERQSAFLRRLENSADDIASTCLDPNTGLPRVMPGASIFMVGHVTRQVHEDSGSQEPCKVGITAAVSGIAALKIFGLMLDSMRERLHSYLQSWLLGTDSSTLNPGDISALSSVITQLWMQQRGSCSPEHQEYVSESESDSYFHGSHGFNSIDLRDTQDSEQYMDFDGQQQYPQATAYTQHSNTVAV